jgi:hypothetical protein
MYHFLYGWNVATAVKPPDRYCPAGLGRRPIDFRSDDKGSRSPRGDMSLTLVQAGWVAAIIWPVMLCGRRD